MSTFSTEHKSRVELDDDDHPSRAGHRRGGRDAARVAAARKRPPPALHRVRLERFAEGAARRSCTSGPTAPRARPSRRCTRSSPSPAARCRAGTTRSTSVTPVGRPPSAADDPPAAGGAARLIRAVPAIHRSGRTIRRGVRYPPDRVGGAHLGSAREHLDATPPSGRTIARRRRHPARLGVGVRGDPRGGGGLLARRAGPRPAAGRHRRARPAAGRPRLGPADPPGVGAARRLRRRLVRHLQRGAQRRRAAPRRRHDGDAGQHRADPDRGVRRPAAGRGLPALAARRHRGRLRRRRCSSAWPPASAEADLVGVVLCVVAAVTYAGGVVAQKPLLRRLPGLQVTFTACAIGAVCCLPWAGTLVGELGAAPGRLDRRHGLPRRGADGAGVQHLGVRAAPDGRRQARRHHLRRPAAGDPARLAAARRGAARRSPLVGGAVCLAGVGIVPAARAGPAAGAGARRRPVPPSERGDPGRRASGMWTGRAEAVGRDGRRFAWRSRTGRRSWPRPRGRRRSTTPSRGGSSPAPTGSTCYLDRERALPVLDPTGRQQIISCGSAVEFAVVALRGRRARAPRSTCCPTTPIPTTWPPCGSPGAREPSDEDRALAAAIERRHTVRARVPAARGARPTWSTGCSARPAVYGTWFKPITRSEEEVATVFLISRAEEMEQSDPAYLAELQSWMRTDPGAVDGVPVEAVPSDDPHARPSNWLIRDFVVGQREQQPAFLGRRRPGRAAAGRRAADRRAHGHRGRRPVRLAAGRPGAGPGAAARHRRRCGGLAAHPGARLAGDPHPAAVPAVARRSPADAAAHGLRRRRLPGRRSAAAARSPTCCGSSRPEPADQSRRRSTGRPVVVGVVVRRRRRPPAAVAGGRPPRGRRRARGRARPAPRRAAPRARPGRSADAGAGEAPQRRAGHGQAERDDVGGDPLRAALAEVLRDAGQEEHRRRPCRRGRAAPASSRAPPTGGARRRPARSARARRRRRWATAPIACTSALPSLGKTPTSSTPAAATASSTGATCPAAAEQRRAGAAAAPARMSAACSDERGVHQLARGRAAGAEGADRRRRRASTSRRSGPARSPPRRRTAGSAARRGRPSGGGSRVTASIVPGRRRRPSGTRASTAANCRSESHDGLLPAGMRSTSASRATGSASSSARSTGSASSVEPHRHDRPVGVRPAGRRARRGRARRAGRGR